MAEIFIDLRDLKLQIDALGSRIFKMVQGEDRTALANMHANLLRLYNSLTPVIQKSDDMLNPIRKNLDYGERKEANIRGDSSKTCPFGLSIPRACSLVGEAIHKMEPLDGKSDEVKEKYKKANNIIFAYTQDRARCPYADKILADKFKKVDCDYGDTGQGQHSGNFQGSPFYPSTFNGSGINGLYSKPLGWYSDNHSARNMFFGLFSYIGKEEYDELIKIANDIGLALKLLLEVK